MTTACADTSRVPPCSIEAEVCVLGSMILDAGYVADIRAIVGSGDFYRPAHQLIFAALADIASADKPVDLVTLGEELKARGQLVDVGGMDYLVPIVEGVPSAANAEHYATIVREHAVRREMIVLGGETANLAYDRGEPIADVLQWVQERAYHLDGRFKASQSYASNVQEGVASVIGRVHDIAEGKPDPNPPIPTGFMNVDGALNGGARRTQLIVVAADTGSGKSALLHNIAANVCRDGGAVLVWSAEMSDHECWRRILSAETEIPGAKLESGRNISPEEWRRLDAAKEHFGKWRLRIVGRTGKVSDVRFEARRLAHQWRRPVDLVCIDHCQRMQPADDRANREQQVASVARDSKSLAMDLKTCVLLASQFNRVGKSAERPNNHDLRGSGSIEDEANTILLLHRNDEQASHIDLAITKNRGGRRTFFGDESMRLSWRPAITKFGTGLF
jgi:replicative DNA helicase